MIYSKGPLAWLYHNTWGKFVYPRLLRQELDAADAAGLKDIRCKLVEQASGQVLEIGAGLGNNIAHYDPMKVTSLTLLEPYMPLRKCLLRHPLLSVKRSVIGNVSIVGGWVERLPFADGSVNTIVMTFVLCTVADPAAVLSEVRRVLKPGGKLLFLEHVRSTDRELAAKQDKWRRVWWFVANGCNCNRRTQQVLWEADRAGVLTMSGSPTFGTMSGAADIVSPIVCGAMVATGKTNESVVEEREVLHA